MSKKGLGKGLSSLIPQSGTTATTALKPQAQQNLPGTVVDVAVEKIKANPHQPRKIFEKEKLQNLANSIKVHGILQPLTVTQKNNNTFELIAGERRLQASKLAGLKKVPVIIKSATEQEKLELAIIENIQRHNLNGIEEALSYNKLMNEYSLTQEQIAKQLGKSRAAVANTLRLLKLPKEIQEAIQSEKISEGHAKALMGIKDPAMQLELFKRILNLGLSVRDTEEKVKKTKVRTSAKPRVKDPVVVDLEEKIQEKLGTKTKINMKKSGGDIVISFFSKDDLKNLLDKLL